jgi:tRNA pseudouridine55 synthase
LARDLGEKLGCGAHVTELVRLRSGRFSLEEAVPLEELERNKLKQYLLPPEAALADLPAVILEKGEEKRIRLGQKVKGSPQGGEGFHKVYSFDGKFLGLAEWDVSARMWQPRMVF